MTINCNIIIRPTAFNKCYLFTIFSKGAFCFRSKFIFPPTAFNNNFSDFTDSAIIKKCKSSVYFLITIF